MATLWPIGCFCSHHNCRNAAGEMFNFQFPILIREGTLDPFESDENWELKIEHFPISQRLSPLCQTEAPSMRAPESYELAVPYIHRSNVAIPQIDIA